MVADVLASCVVDFLILIVGGGRMGRRPTRSWTVVWPEDSCG